MEARGAYGPSRLCFVPPPVLAPAAYISLGRILRTAHSLTNVCRIDVTPDLLVADIFVNAFEFSSR